MTGYVVHYSSNGVTNSIPGLSSTSTSHEITGLTKGRTYSISVEATSEHLSGESEPITLTLGECFFSDRQQAAFWNQWLRKFNMSYIMFMYMYMNNHVYRTLFRYRKKERSSKE